MSRASDKRDALGKPTGGGPQSLADKIRKVSKSPALAAPYNLARRAVLDRDMPVFFGDQRHPEGKMWPKGKTVYCARSGHRTWICLECSPVPNEIPQMVIANTRDLTFKSSITNMPYKLVGDMQYRRSWQLECRKNPKIRWARRILGQALHDGEPSIWHSSVQRQVDDLVHNLYARVGFEGAELLRFIAEHQVSAARKSVAMCGLTGDHHIWKPLRNRGDGYNSGMIQKRIEALQVLINIKEVIHVYAK